MVLKHRIFTLNLPELFVTWGLFLKKILFYAENEMLINMKKIRSLFVSIEINSVNESNTWL